MTLIGEAGFESPLTVGAESDLAWRPSDGGDASGSLRGAEAECGITSGPFEGRSTATSLEPEAAKLWTSASILSSGPRSSSPRDDGERARVADCFLLGSGEPRAEVGALGPVDVNERCEARSDDCR
jgi:hypothetical protein